MTLRANRSRAPPLSGSWGRGEAGPGTCAALQVVVRFTSTRPPREGKRLHWPIPLRTSTLLFTVFHKQYQEEIRHKPDMRRKPACACEHAFEREHRGPREEDDKEDGDNDDEHQVVQRPAGQQRTDPWSSPCTSLLAAMSLHLTVGHHSSLPS